jgi:hypothetical protein
MNDKQKLIAGGVIAGGLMLGAAALVIGAGFAHADGHDTEGTINDQNGAAFALELAHDGVIGSDVQATNLAMQVCRERAGGIPERSIQFGYSADTTIDLVDGAEYHFCPAYEMKLVGVTPVFVNVPGQGWFPNDPQLLAVIAQGRRMV